mgnify:CR=1 FL=1
MQTLFTDRFGSAPSAEVAVPGRVNLLGEWTDFSGGLVLPMALALEVRLALAANGLGHDRIASAQFEGTTLRPIGGRAQGHWSDYAAGGLARARALGWAGEGGFDVALDSTVPHGSGLSTSAAVIVGVLRMLAPQGTSPTEVAVEARKVENEFIGVPCGIMDQMAVALAAPGQVLALDTGTLAFEAVPLPPGWSVAIVHSGVSRELADGRYKERRDEILAAAGLLGVEQLCQADLAAAERLPPPLAARARHVISEDRRTRAALAQLKRGDIDAFGAAMREGQRSISRDLAITTPAIDAQVALIERHGAVAARQTGGGFGGCIVVLDRAGEPGRWWEPLSSAFPDARRIV